MSAGLNFEYGFNTNTAKPLEEEASMRVYFLGDFAGAISTEKNGSEHSIVKIDIDNFDNVMTKLSPSIELPSGEMLTFNELEDFHPDNLFEHTIFDNLRRLKRELTNTATAEGASQEILSKYQRSNQHHSNGENTQVDLAIDEVVGSIEDSTKNCKTENKDDMFERLLGKKQSATNITKISGVKNTDNLNKFLADLLNPLIIDEVKPEHKNLILFIDTAIEELMKSIISSNEFKARESAWRSVRDVIFNTEYDEAYQLFYLVNTGQAALKKSIDGDNSFLTKLSQHVKDIDREHYDVLIGNYQFSDVNDDIKMLNYLACLAETLKCQFIGAANDSLINTNVDSLWYQFRQTPQAKCVALSYPQILLRLPYGKAYDEIDSFPFEELNQEHLHDELLWGNSSFSCAQLLIRQYHSSESRKLNTNITDLPAFVYTSEGEQKLLPCGEFLLSEQQLSHIRNQGIMAFISYRNKNSIRLFTDGIQAVNSE